jgi:hypothetical protein
LMYRWVSYEFTQYSSVCEGKDVFYSELVFFALCKPADPGDPRSLGRRSAAAGLLGLRVRIPPRAWMLYLLCWQVEVSVSSLITRREESYRVWCVCWLWSYDNEKALAHWGAVALFGEKSQCH